MQKRRHKQLDSTDQLPLLGADYQVASETPPASQELEDVASEKQETPDDAPETGLYRRHIVQPFRIVTSKGKKGHKSALTPVDPLLVVSEDAARERAERIFETGNYAGVDAYTVTGNPEMGEYGEPVFHVRLGNVPRHEGWE